jgi:uncharacterized protein
MTILYPELIKAVTRQFRLSKESPHGPAHWMRVRKNGLILANATNANTNVIELFALFHDSCRENDYDDPEHGLRAVTLAKIYYKNGRINCSEDKFSDLSKACNGHTGGENPDNITIAVCWDADRLYLSRVGITPLPELLFTDVAKSSQMIDSASQRASEWLQKSASTF